MDNMTGAEKAKEIRNSIFALLIAFIFLFPIYWLIQISFKSDAETFGKVLTIGSFKVAIAILEQMISFSLPCGIAM